MSPLLTVFTCLIIHYSCYYWYKICNQVVLFVTLLVDLNNNSRIMVFAVSLCRMPSCLYLYFFKSFCHHFVLFVAFDI